MKTLSLILISMLISPMGFSDEVASFESALSLFQKRDRSEQGMANARTASKMYLELFNTLKAPEKRAEASLKYCQAQFFIGERSDTDEDKRTEFKAGFELADKGIKLIQKGRRPGKAKKREWSETLAKLYYWQPATVGRWGESQSMASVLFKWGKMKKRIKAIKKMGFQHVVGYGADRFLGRALYEMPGALGDKEGAVKNLLVAHKNTLHPEFKISNFPLGDIYLADAYIATGKTDMAIELLERMVEVLDEGKAEELNDFYMEKLGNYRLSEIKEELEMARERLEDL